jgi:uncharacterized membrane protein YkvA (DUF1232 family)
MIDANWLKTQLDEVNRNEMQEALQHASGVLSELTVTPELRDFEQDMQDMLDLLEDYLEGRWTKVSAETPATIVFAVRYVLDPADAIPDNTPGLGFLDDFRVLSLCVESMREDLDAYLAAKRT